MQIDCSKKVYKQHFRSAWAKDFDWIEERDDQVFCTVCQGIVKGSFFHLQRHAKTPKHKKKLGSVIGVPKISVALNNRQSAKNLERKITMFAVQYNVAFNAIGDLTKLIKYCGKNAKATANIKLSRTKAADIVKSEFGPEQQSKLATVLKGQYFSIIMDESTDVSSKKCLAITVRYFDDIKTVSRFFGLVEVPFATAKHLFDAVKGLLDQLRIPITNIIGYGADNANTMMGSKSGLKKLFEDEVPSIFVMGCICHSLDLCSSSAAKKLPPGIEGLVHDVYNHFAHSAKRKTIFAKAQEMFDVYNHAILRPCDTRWLSLKVI